MSDLGTTTSVEAIIYEGLARYGTSFTRDVGNFFEGYVGRQLRTMIGPIIYPEITYHGPGG